ncbi:MAG: hypothetical protein PUC44_03515 [Eubacteriales bacterium]|nr:hypothetical protein [Eubacteriales bacterium]
MKNLIITAAILIYALVMMGSFIQLDRTGLMHREMQCSAEEAAAAAAVSGKEETADGEIQFRKDICESAAKEAAFANLEETENPELRIRYKEGVHPQVQVQIRKGKFRAEAVCALVRTENGWRVQRR